MNSSLVAIQTSVGKKDLPAAYDKTDKLQRLPGVTKTMAQLTVSHSAPSVEKCPPATQKRTVDRLVLGKPRSLWRRGEPLHRNTHQPLLIIQCVNQWQCRIELASLSSTSWETNQGKAGVGISKGRKSTYLVHASYLWLADRAYDAFTRSQHLDPSRYPPQIIRVSNNWSH